MPIPLWSALMFDDPIDQQHRIAMRKRFKDGVDIHHLDFDGDSVIRLPRRSASAKPIPGPAHRRAPAARRRRSPGTTAWSLGKEAAPAPAGGTSSLTPLIAVIWARPDVHVIVDPYPGAQRHMVANRQTATERRLGASKQCGRR